MSANDEKQILRNELDWLTFVVLVPYVGRFLNSFFVEIILKSFFCNYCFEGQNPLLEACGLTEQQGPVKYRLVISSSVDEKGTVRRAEMVTNGTPVKHGDVIELIEDREVKFLEVRRNTSGHPMDDTEIAKDKINNNLRKKREEMGETPREVPDRTSAAVRPLEAVLSRGVRPLSPSSLTRYFVAESWEEARLAMRYTYNMAIAVSVLRLFFWHLAQPLLYFIVLYLYWDLISKAQFVLGCCVAVRESLYVVIIIAALFYRCPFLLANLSSGWKRGDVLMSTRLKRLMFFFATPERFVLIALLKKIWGKEKELADEDIPDIYLKSFDGPAGLSAPINAVMFLFGVLDFCGCCALVMSIVYHESYPPLLVGYGVTMLSLLSSIAVVIYRTCWDFQSLKDLRQKAREDHRGSAMMQVRAQRDSLASKDVRIDRV